MRDSEKLLVFPPKEEMSVSFEFPPPKGSSPLGLLFNEEDELNFFSKPDCKIWDLFFIQNRSESISPFSLLFKREHSASEVLSLFPWEDIRVDLIILACTPESTTSCEEAELSLDKLKEPAGDRGKMLPPDNIEADDLFSGKEYFPGAGESNVSPDNSFADGLGKTPPPDEDEDDY